MFTKYVVIALFLLNISFDALSKVEVFPGVLSGDVLLESSSRGTPELYLFSADDTLSLRYMGLPEKVSRDLKKVIFENKTLYRKQTQKEIEQEVSNAYENIIHKVKVKLENNPIVPKEAYESIYAKVKEDIKASVDIPIYSKTDIIEQLKNSEGNRLATEALNDKGNQYFLITFHADWCEPCKVLETEITTLFNTNMPEKDLVWIKIERDSKKVK